MDRSTAQGWEGLTDSAEAVAGASIQEGLREAGWRGRHEGQNVCRMACEMP